MALQQITLHDESSGSTASILAGYGFNCYSFKPVYAGEPVEVLWSAPGFESAAGRPSHSGIPILFPFAGRLGGSELIYQGRSYPLENLDALGNAIHGLVLDRPWRVTERQPHRAVGEFQASVDEPALANRWPADFRLAVTYELAGTALVSRVEVFNPGDAPLPFGFGTHPYFRVPLGAGGKAADCRVTVPASEYWELVDFVPTGKRLAADGRRGIAGGLALGETRLDHVFTALSYEGGSCRATLDDPHSGRTVELDFDDQFRHCVVYIPPHREAICIEPYTSVPDPFTLSAAGVETGLRTLAPGEAFTARILIRLK